MVEPLSKEPNCSHHQSRPGYVLRSTPLINWIRVQEGNFLRCLQALGSSSGDAGWVTTGFQGAQPPLFAIPSFTFKVDFWAVLPRSFRQLFTRWSGLPHPKQFWFFLWYSLTVLAKWTIYPTDWSALPIPLKVSASSSAEDSASSSFSGFTLESSSASVLSTIADQASEGTVALQLPSGKQIPWCLQLSNIQYSSCGGLWKQMTSGFCQSFQPLGKHVTIDDPPSKYYSSHEPSSESDEDLN